MGAMAKQGTAVISVDPARHGIDQASQPLLDLYAYWCLKAGEKPFASRSDLDPVEIPSLLTHILLVELTPDGRFRFRLAGSHSVGAAGMELTGKFVDDVALATYRGYLSLMYFCAVQTLRPYYSVARFRDRQSRKEKVSEKIVMPLGDDDVSMLLVGQQVHFPEGAPVTPLSPDDQLILLDPVVLNCPEPRGACRLKQCRFPRPGSCLVTPNEATP